MFGDRGGVFEEDFGGGTGEVVLLESGEDVGSEILAATGLGGGGKEGGGGGEMTLSE